MRHSELVQALPPYLCPRPDGRIVPVYFRPGRPGDAHPLHAACYRERPWRRFAAAFDRAARRHERGRGVWLVGGTEAAAVCGGQLLLHGRLAEIADIAVAPAWRRRGIATALLAALTAVATGHDVDEIEIGVLQSNTSALALYQSLGYHPRRDLATPGGPAIILGRQLGTAAAE